MPRARITVLGSGTSTGVPVIGCTCAVCLSTNPRNNRTRASIMLTLENGESIVVDTGPEFRIQALRAGLKRLKHVIYTHTHADHLHGFDDLRAFWFHSRESVVCHISSEHEAELRERFSYAFHPTGYQGIKPQVELEVFQDERRFAAAGLTIEPSLLPHGDTTSAALRIGRFVYATDFKSVPNPVKDRWRGQIDLMIASGVHFGPHRTHSTIPETLALFQDLRVKQGIITHLAHEVEIDRDSALLPLNVQYAYDGMAIDAVL